MRRRLLAPGLEPALMAAVVNQSLSDQVKLFREKLQEAWNPAYLLTYSTDDIPQIEASAYLQSRWQQAQQASLDPEKRVLFTLHREGVPLGTITVSEGEVVLETERARVVFEDAYRYRRFLPDLFGWDATRVTTARFDPGVSVTRPSPWGNPIRFFPLSCPICGQQHEDDEEGRKELFTCYHLWLQQNVYFRNRVRYHLRGERVSCVCGAKLCHADLLAYMADSPAELPDGFWL